MPRLISTPGTRYQRMVRVNEDVRDQAALVCTTAGYRLTEVVPVMLTRYAEGRLSVREGHEFGPFSVSQGFWVFRKTQVEAVEERAAREGHGTWSYVVRAIVEMIAREEIPVDL